MSTSSLPAIVACGLLPWGGCGKSATATGDAAAGHDAGDGAADAVVDAVDAIAAEGCVSFRASSCPSGSWCQGSSACGSTWQCSMQYPSSCTAGIVGLLCGCDGVVQATDGCPTRHAYDLGSQFGRAWDALSGARCDPGRGERPPFAMRYRLQGRGLDAFEGKSVVWRFSLSEASAPLLPELAGAQRGTVRSGALDWEERPAGPVMDSRGVALHEGFLAEVFIDVDGDGACKPMVDRGGALRPPSVDFVGLRFEYTLGPDSLSAADAQLCSRLP